MSDKEFNISDPWTWNIEDLNITGTAADDTLYGGKGQDRIDGGGGTDTVSYGSSRDSYEVTHDAATGTYSVLNLRLQGRDVDTLTGIERLSFSDVEAPIAAFAVDAPPELRPIVFTPTDGADSLVGREYGETIDGRDGDDVFQGNGGTDRLYGGKGEDTAFYAGNFVDYELVFDQAEYAYRLTDRVSGRDGSDLLWGVEKLHFADLTVLLTGDQGARIEGGPEVLPPWVPPPYDPISYSSPMPWIDSGITDLVEGGWVGTTSQWTGMAAETMLVGTAWTPLMLATDA